MKLTPKFLLSVAVVALAVPVAAPAIAQDTIKARAR